ncbi:MAG: SDR family NAD(P)-dependent oxidoreductase, partial [Leptospiraceae bacterium]|nr:SDR family NAD(P)-dependent oxidoreductase [Leptospiraceae bacterium]
MASPKRILITGAGSGIGLETALELSRRNQSVIAGIRNPKKFQAHWKEIGMEGAPPFEIASFDVTRPDQIKKEVARL